MKEKSNYPDGSLSQLSGDILYIKHVLKINVIPFKPCITSGFLDFKCSFHFFIALYLSSTLFVTTLIMTIINLTIAIMIVMMVMLLLVVTVMISVGERGKAGTNKRNSAVRKKTRSPTILHVFLSFSVVSWIAHCTS